MPAVIDVAGPCRTPRRAHPAKDDRGVPTVAEAHIDAETRTEFGKGADPQHLSLPSLEFARVIREQGRNAVLTLNISGQPQLALTKTVVTHPIRPYIEHVDLVVISRGEKVAVDVLIVITGEAAVD